MTFEDFDRLCDEIDRQCNEMRDTKGREYAHDADRFTNFKRHAQSLGIDPKMVLYIYMAKHWDAITGYIKSGGQTFSTEPIQGRIKDNIVYLKLLWGLIEEEQTTPAAKNCSGCGGTGILESIGQGAPYCPACRGTGKEVSK
jgi:hypothetical protein